jgi:hypothetical protein
MASSPCVLIDLPQHSKGLREKCVKVVKLSNELYELFEPESLKGLEDRFKIKGSRKKTMSMGLGAEFCQWA